MLFILLGCYHCVFYLLLHKIKVEITYSTPIVTTLMMNWGFSYHDANIIAFAPYGSWNVTTEYAYDYVRKMMVNFHQ